jgi:hypothetical protein
MTALSPNPIRPTTDGQRVRVVADAVVSSYINELSRPVRQTTTPRRPAAPAFSRAPRRGLCEAAMAR